MPITTPIPNAIQAVGTSQLNYIPPNLQYYYDTMSVDDKATFLALPVTEQVDRLKILEQEHNERVTEKRAELEKEKKEEEKATIRVNNSVEPNLPPILKVKEEALEESSSGESKGVTFADVGKSESSNSGESSSGVKKITI